MCFKRAVKSKTATKASHDFVIFFSWLCIRKFLHSKNWLIETDETHFSCGVFRKTVITGCELAVQKILKKTITRQPITEKTLLKKKKHVDHSIVSMTHLGHVIEDCVSPVKASGNVPV